MTHTQLVIVKKDGALSQNAKFFLMSILDADTRGAPLRFQLRTTAGRGVHSHYSKTAAGAGLPALLYFGIKHTVKNDAPRGGALGEFVEIPRSQIEKVRHIVAAYSD